MTPADSQERGPFLLELVFGFHGHGHSLSGRAVVFLRISRAHVSAKTGSLSAQSSSITGMYERSPAKGITNCRSGRLLDFIRHSDFDRTFNLQSSATPQVSYSPLFHGLKNAI